MLDTSAIVRPYHGRIYITLQDMDGSDVFPHGIAVAPPSIRTKEQALREIDAAYFRAVDANPEEWNYDDVIQQIKAAGFDHIDCAHWIEHEAHRFTAELASKGPRR